MPPEEFGDGALVKERSDPKIYVVYDGKKFWIPTSDALSIMGHGGEVIWVVDDGELASLPEVSIDSLSPTPGSLVFPPLNDPNPPYLGRHFAIRGVNTSIRVVSQGKEVRVIELRGWLYPYPGALTNSEPEWDDYHYELEVDSKWAADRGIDLNQILKVGNIILSEGHGIDKGSPDSYRSFSLPRINIEINGWKPGNSRRVARPDDWTFTLPPDFQNNEFPNTRWPYDPRAFPIPGSTIDEGAAQYFRMVGSLMADREHGRDATDRWVEGIPRESEANPARFTEIHPPDLIELLPNQPRRETLRGIAVVAGTGLFDAEVQEIDVTIAPPGAKPSPDHKVGVVELVGPETDLATIVSGNAQRDGAQITVGPNDVRVYVRLRRLSPPFGIPPRPGKFKAIYRVLWAHRGQRPPGVVDFDWVDEVLPQEVTTAGDSEGWRWVSADPAPFSGAVAHQSNIVGGMHQHYFFGAPQFRSDLHVGAGDRLFAYVHPDPQNPPSEIMLQWNDGSWEHRAYWGANNISWGVDGTASRRPMGPLPPAGQWTRLEVTAALVGLEGRRVNGMAFTLFDGRATWDCAGIVRKPNATVPQVVGRRRDVAINMINAADLVPRFRNFSFDPDAVVASQSPAGGTIVARGSTVTCTLRLGPSP
jgi:hypothetical protein